MNSNSALPYLTNEEIKGITEPLTQPAAIVRWFRANGFSDCKVKPNGLPLIYRSEFYASPVAETTKENAAHPDVAGYLAKLAKRSKSKAHA